MLAYAEAVVASEECPSCGRPKWICWNEDPDIEFRLTRPICHAVRKKDVAEKNRKGDPEPGSLIDLEVYVASRTDLVEFRRPWQEEREKLHAQWDKDRPTRPRAAPPGGFPEDLDSAAQ